MSSCLSHDRFFNPARFGWLLTAWLVLAPAVTAAPGALLHSFLPPAPQANDYFGWSVALVGDVAAVSASYTNAGANDAGEVYLFDANPAHPGFGQLLSTIPNPEPAPSSHFGSALAAAGGLLVVGAYQVDSGAALSGTVYLYDADPASATFGDLLKRIPHPFPSVNDQFGWAVAGDETYCLVGAPNGNAGALHAGSAYLFDARRGAPTFGELLLTIQNPTPQPLEELGWAVAIKSGLIAVGARGANGAATRQGEVLLYDAASRGFAAASLATLTVPDPLSADYFGASLALTEEKLIVGAPNKDLPGIQDPGVVYVYNRASVLSGGTSPVLTLGSPTPFNTGHFGTAVTSTLTTMYVGAWGEDFGGNAAGAVYAFDVHGGGATSTAEMRLLSPPPGAGNYFGYSLATDGSRLLVGAILTDSGVMDAGAAHLFEGNNAAREWLRYD